MNGEVKDQDDESLEFFPLRIMNLYIMQIGYSPIDVFVTFPEVDIPVPI